MRTVKKLYIETWTHVQWDMPLTTSVATTPPISCMRRIFYIFIYYILLHLKPIKLYFHSLFTLSKHRFTLSPFLLTSLNPSSRPSPSQALTAVRRPAFHVLLRTAKSLAAVVHPTSCCCCTPRPPANREEPRRRRRCCSHSRIFLAGCGSVTSQVVFFFVFLFFIVCETW